MTSPEHKEQRHTGALLVNPPFLKYDAGPPLGPALLVSACRHLGLPLDFVDLNALYLGRTGGDGRVDGPWPPPIGDHARPNGSLGGAEDRFLGELGVPPDEATRRRWRAVQVDERELDAIADRLDTPELRLLLDRQPPRLVGFSVMAASQVPWVFAACRQVRRRWPGTRVVLGGAYLGVMELDRPEQQAAWVRWADLMVVGHAETRFAGLVRLAFEERELPVGLLAGDAVWTPANVALSADLLRAYPCLHPMVPVQTSVGCAFGRCAFCSYPAVEPNYVPGDVAGLVRPAVELAMAVNGALVIKDSYVVAHRLQEVAAVVGGRVKFAACTRLQDAARPGVLRFAAAGGLDTLELGLETIDPAVARSLEKRQSMDQLLAVCAAAEHAGVHLVLNTIHGLPGQTEAEAREARTLLHHGLREAFPALRCRVEENALELERSTPLAANPSRWGVTPGRRWPFAAVIEHDLPGWVLPLLAEPPVRPTRKDVA